jgi:hypothetical protein
LITSNLNRLPNGGKLLSAEIRPARSRNSIALHASP